MIIALMLFASCQTLSPNKPRWKTIKRQKVEQGFYREHNQRSAQVKRSLVPINSHNDQYFQELYKPVQRTFREFQQPSSPLKGHYADMQSQSFKSQNLKLLWPLEGGRITSPYGMRKNRFHAGIDIAAPQGTPVYASASGRVLLTRNHRRLPGYGNVIVIGHHFGLQTIYAHLKRIHVIEGQMIKQKDLIGEVGNTGHSTGPHLHFEARISQVGIAVNPLDLLEVRNHGNKRKKTSKKIAQFLQQNVNAMIADSLH